MCPGGSQCPNPPVRGVEVLGERLTCPVNQIKLQAQPRGSRSDAYEDVYRNSFNILLCSDVVALQEANGGFILILGIQTNFVTNARGTSGSAKQNSRHLQIVAPAGIQVQCEQSSGQQNTVAAGKNREST